MCVCVQSVCVLRCLEAYSVESSPKMMMSMFVPALVFPLQVFLKNISFPFFFFFLGINPLPFVFCISTKQCTFDLYKNCVFHSVWGEIELSGFFSASVAVSGQVYIVTCNHYCCCIVLCI